MGRSKKTAMPEEVEKQKKAVSEDKAKADEKPVVRILSHGSCPKLSARGVGDLEYEVGINDETDEVFIRIAGNESSGAYSTKWINLDNVQTLLDAVEEETFKAVVFRDLYAGQSSCNTGYLGAILKALGILVAVDKPSRALRVGNWDKLMVKITQLKEEGVNLTDEITISAVGRAKKKSTAAGKKKTVKKKSTSKP